MLSVCEPGIWSHQQNTMEKKHTVSEYLSLDVRNIRQIFSSPSGKMTSIWTVTPAFGAPQTFTSTLIFSGGQLYVTDPFDGIEMPVTILPRKMYFGGWRKFWQCPWCSRVCELIYFSSNDYGCRICLELTYSSAQQAHKNDHLLRHMFPNFPLRLAKKFHREIFMKQGLK